MGYPRKYVGRYPPLANWLRDNGHAVYPMEMHCKPVCYCPPGSEGNYLRTRYLYGYVDVVSLFSGKLYAWEYKSASDNVKRGLLQLENYARSFDYVCLVTTGLDRLVKIRDKLRAIGAGSYYWEGDGYHMLDKPQLQNPEPILHEKLVARFQRYVFPNEHAKLQRKLQETLERERFQKQHRQLTEFF